jgi:hypothetical protein
MKQSLQQIEDYYIRKGLSGSKLRKALEADKGYREIVAKRKVRLTKKIQNYSGRKERICFINRSKL